MYKNNFFFFQICFGWRKQGIKIPDLYFTVRLIGMGQHGQHKENGPALVQYKKWACTGYT